MRIFVFARYAPFRINSKALMNIVKAYETDFERVLPLLSEFNNQTLTKDDWAKLFKHSWKTEETHHGLILEDEEGIAVGFLGLLFSERTINNKQYKFCNMTAWIVKNDYRNFSLALLFQAMSQTDYIYTNLTPNRALWKILRRLDFVCVDEFFRITLPLPHFFAWKYGFTSDIKQIMLIADDDERQALADHSAFKINAYMLFSDNKHCLVIAKKTYKKRVPVAQTLFVGNKTLFTKYIGLFTFRICIDLKAPLLLTGEHFFEPPIKSSLLKFKRKTFFKGNGIDKNDIDFLYSELC
jgi:hypothetical protein